MADLLPRSEDADDTVRPAAGTSIARASVYAPCRQFRVGGAVRREICSLGLQPRAASHIPSAPPPQDAADLGALEHLHEPALLLNSRKRFLRQAPYTSCGSVCIAVNPYQVRDRQALVLTRPESLTHPQHANVTNCGATGHFGSG